MRIRNRITELLGVEVPIVQAPMGFIARAARLGGLQRRAGGRPAVNAEEKEMDTTGTVVRRHLAAAVLLGSLAVSPLTAQIAGGALDCDGVDDQAIIPDTHGDFDMNTTMTLEGWVRYDDLEGGSGVVGGFTPPDGAAYSLGEDEGVGDPPLFFVSTQFTNAAAGPSLATGAWTHLAGTYDGATLRLYVNGVLADSTAHAGNVIDVTELRLCRHPRNVPLFLHGTIDEVRVWKVARSAADISDNYQRVLDGDEPGLVAYYQFDEGAGQAIVDSSAAGNDGSLGATGDPGSDDPARVVSGAPLVDPGVCVRDSRTACLLGGRFEVRVTMKDFGDPPVTFPGFIQTYGGQSSETDQSVSYYSFKNGNVEIFIKMVDACGNPNYVSYWLFAAGATSADTLILVRDTGTEEVYQIHNPPGLLFETVADTQAFQTCEL